MISFSSTNPLISFIVPTYNSEEFIENCILSIINQKYNNIEIIIIDGQSKDKTLSILEKYKTHIKTVISEKDKGIYDAINKGILLSKGDFVKILNSDDELTYNSISLALNMLTLNINKLKDDNFIIMGNLERINIRGEKLAIWGEKNTFLFENLLHPSWYVPKSIYDKYGLYDLKYKIASDYDYFLRLKSNEIKLIKSSDQLTRYREGGASKDGSGRLEVYMIKKKYKGVLEAKLLLLQIKIIILLSKTKRFLLK